MDMNDTVPARAIEEQVALLLRLADRPRRRTRTREGELDRSGYLVLGVLADFGPANVNTIAGRLRLDPSTVTRQVLALESAGHAVRSPDPEDGRGTVVRPTSEGLDALQTSHEIRTRLYDEILVGWSPADRTLLGDLLTRLNVDLDTWGRTAGA